jgi:hypothetical protein
MEGISAKVDFAAMEAKAEAEWKCASPLVVCLLRRPQSLFVCGYHSSGEGMKRPLIAEA